MLTAADLHFFAALARSPSLAAAARDLGVTPSAVTQRLQELERRVGVRLVERSGRRLTLTDEGELLAARGEAIVDDLADLGEVLAARRGVVAGRLRVLAPLGFGRRYVAPIAGRFCVEHPEVALDLVLSDRMGRVPETSWDVAVHIGELRDSSLVAHRLAPNERVVCASPALVERFGAPAEPAELRRLPCIALRENDEDVTMWRFTRPDGTPTHVRVEPRLATNDGEVVREWAVAGHGVIVRSEWSVADDLRAGRLVRLLADHRMASADVVAFVGARRGRSARTTRFVEHLHAALTPAPWRALALLLAVLLAACRTGRNYPGPAEPRYAGGAPVSAGRGATADTLRVVSYNIAFARRVDAAIAVLASAPEARGADVVLLQEMDERGTRRVAEALGMAYVYYPAIHHRRTRRDFGNAVLSRWPIVADAKLVLPHRSRYARTQRTATAATLRVGDALVRVYSTHLGTPADVSGAARRAQLAAIADDAAGHARVVIGGDMNDGSVGQVARERGFAWPTAAGPRTTRFGRWDHIFLRGLASPAEGGAGTVRDARHASDHHPVWALAVVR